MSTSELWIEELLTWGEIHQAYLSPAIDIYRDPITGLSFKARQSFPARSTLVTCPYGISLSYLNAIGSASFSRHSTPFPSEFLAILDRDDPNIIGCFFLIQQYLLGAESFWFPYMRLLPQPNEAEKLAIPIWWPEEDQRFLVGTNAEPPMKKRKELWIAEWEKGVSLLQGTCEGWEKYTYQLYQWAATIFGTRSFRASLTVSDAVLRTMQTNDHVVDHVKRDRFSILFPILDIGNHDGKDNAEWNATSETGLSLANRGIVGAGDQIYNFYGHKSNSELLVGYGFILPAGAQRETVNLKLKPAPEALSLRQRQSCYVVPAQPDEATLITVQGQMKNTEKQGKFDLLPHGLIDLIICMVANSRERQFISSNPGYCPGNDKNLLRGPLYRSAVQMVSILLAKFQSEMRRFKESGRGLGKPQNSNQTLATDYRKRQLQVLEEAEQHMTTVWLEILRSDVILQNPRGGCVQTLFLETAFHWLQQEYPSISSAVTRFIAEDQEEPLPLTWDVLLEDWDHTYGTVWFFLLLLLWAQDSSLFNTKYPALSCFIVDMNRTYEHALSSHDVEGCLHAEPSEKDTIMSTTSEICHLEPFNTGAMGEWLTVPSTLEKLRNMASWIAKEETFLALPEKEISKGIMQKAFCVRAADEVAEWGTGGSWLSFLRGLLLASRQ